MIKIRLQAQHHSMADPLDIPKYRNAAHAAYTVVREEGFRTLYRGVTLTALRQSTNQAVNFTAYTYMKQYALSLQPSISELPSYQHLLLGLVSGAMGPLSNAPIDTISSHLQLGPTLTAWLIPIRNTAPALRSSARGIRAQANNLHCKRHVQTRRLSSILPGYHTENYESSPRTGKSSPSYPLCRNG